MVVANLISINKSVLTTNNLPFNMNYESMIRLLLSLLVPSRYNEMLTILVSSNGFAHLCNLSCAAFPHTILFSPFHSLCFLNCYGLSCFNVDIASSDNVSQTTKTLIPILLLNFHGNLNL